MLCGVMGCELLTSVFKKRNDSNGHGFMTVWTVDILPLKQLATPHDTVCIFYDAALLTCRNWMIYFTLGSWGLAAVHTHFESGNYITETEPLPFLYINIMT